MPKPIDVAVRAGAIEITAPHMERIRVPLTAADRIRLGKELLADAGYSADVLVDAGIGSRFRDLVAEAMGTAAPIAPPSPAEAPCGPSPASDVPDEGAKSETPVKPPRRAVGHPRDDTHLAAVLALGEEGLSANEIAKRLGIGRTIARRMLGEAGLFRRNGVRAHNVERNRILDARIPELLAEGKTDAEMAAVLGVSRYTIQTRRSGMGLRPSAPIRGGSKPLMADEIADLAAKGLPVPDIAIRLGLKDSTVRKRLYKLGIEAAPAPPRETKFDSMEESDATEIIRLSNLGLFATEVAAVMKGRWSPKDIQRYRAAHGIKFEPRTSLSMKALTSRLERHVRAGRTDEQIAAIERWAVEATTIRRRMVGLPEGVPLPEPPPKPKPVPAPRVAKPKAPREPVPATVKAPKGLAGAVAFSPTRFNGKPRVVAPTDALTSRETEIVAMLAERWPPGTAIPAVEAAVEIGKAFDMLPVRANFAFSQIGKKGHLVRAGIPGSSDSTIRIAWTPSGQKVAPIIPGARVEMRNGVPVTILPPRTAAGAYPLKNLG